MKPSIHDELMESLAELRKALPSMRLGQLIANMATAARGAVAGAVWDVEDEVKRSSLAAQATLCRF